MKIDIAVPVYNEQQTLKKQIYKLEQFLKEQKNHEYRIIIADNGSTDKTKSIAEELSISIPRVYLVSVGQKGVGLALKKAWENSDADVIGYMDLDLATSLKHILDVADLFHNDECDFVNASRLLENSLVRNRSRLRNLTSRSFNFLLKRVFDTKSTDGMCGFKFIKQTTLKSILSNGATSEGWFFSTQILIISEMLGLRVREIPIEWTDDRNSKVKIAKLTTMYIREILKMRKVIRHSKYKKFVKL